MGAYEENDIEFDDNQSAEFLALLLLYIGNGRVRRTVARGNQTAMDDMIGRLGKLNAVVVDEWKNGIHEHRHAFEEVGAFAAGLLCTSRPCFTRLLFEAIKEMLPAMRTTMKKYVQTGG